MKSVNLVIITLMLLSVLVVANGAESTIIDDSFSSDTINAISSKPMVIVVNSESNKVKIRGEVVNDLPAFSFYEVDVKIGEIILDSTGALNVGDVVRVASHVEGPAVVEEYWIGATVEVYGDYSYDAYTGHNIFLSNYDDVSSDNYLIIVPSEGSISVSSNPIGASIYLDGTYNGLTPKILNEVSTGSHTVNLRKSGYEYYTITVDVQGGVTSTVSATLDPVITTGFISVSSNPTGASIYLDGVYNGLTPKTLADVSTGSHTVKLSKSGYTDYINTVSVQNGITSTVSGILGSEVEFRGNVIDSVVSFSFIAYTVQIEEIISDPLNVLNKGDTSIINIVYGSPSEQDIIENGDYVEVKGTYTYDSDNNLYIVDLTNSDHSILLADATRILFDTTHDEYWTTENFDYSSLMEIYSNRKYDEFVSHLEENDYVVTVFNYNNLYYDYPAGVLFHNNIYEDVSKNSPNTILNYDINIPQGIKSIAISVNSIVETEGFARVRLLNPSNNEMFTTRVDWTSEDHSTHIHNPESGQWSLEVELGSPSWDISNFYDFKVDVGIVPTLKDELENNEYDILIMGAPGDDLDKFTNEDTESVYNFVANGGNLLLLGATYYTSYENYVANKFNNNVHLLLDQDHTKVQLQHKVTGSEITPHPILEGIDEFYYYGQDFDLGSWGWNIIGTQTPVAYALGNPIISAFQHGGKVVIIGSGETFSDEHID
nr:PEGA domain-containing protein [uncultured Methanolobus sp.]